MERQFWVRVQMTPVLDKLFAVRFRNLFNTFFHTIPPIRIIAVRKADLLEAVPTELILRYSMPSVQSESLHGDSKKCLCFALVKKKREHGIVFPFLLKQLAQTAL